jgi:hypothetical protein
MVCSTFQQLGTELRHFVAVIAEPRVRLLAEQDNYGEIVS